MHVLLHIGERASEPEVWQWEMATVNVLNGQRYAICKLQIG
jgi:hypothetical protein